MSRGFCHEVSNWTRDRSAHFVGQFFTPSGHLVSEAMSVFEEVLARLIAGPGGD
jgi:hypothetical protein